MINDRLVLDKLFTSLAERYKERPGGYTRIVKLGCRPGDNAPLSVIQLVQEEMPEAKKSTKKAKAPAKKVEAVEAAAEVVETKDVELKDI